MEKAKGGGRSGWSECNDMTWKNPVISMVCMPSARGFYPIAFASKDDNAGINGAKAVM